MRRDDRSPEGERLRLFPHGGERSALRDVKTTDWYRPVAGAPASPLMVPFKKRSYDRGEKEKREGDEMVISAFVQ